MLHGLNTIKDFPTSFPFLTLHTVNLLLWRKILSHSFQNNYSNQIKHTPKGGFYGESRFATKGGTGKGSERPPWLIWKTSLELNLLVQNSVLQNYLPELYPLYSSSYQTMFHLLWFCLLPPPCIDCSISSPKSTVLGKPCRWGDSFPAIKKLFISNTRKIPLTK